LNANQFVNPLPTPADQATEDQLKSALASVGVPVPLSVVVNNLDEAIAAVAKVGGRSVMKAVIPGLVA
jgi:phosphoribosylaminoimidazole carboxylase (NCAIR synthetase)